MNTPTDTAELLTAEEARTLSTALTILDRVDDRARRLVWERDAHDAYRHGRVAEACERARAEVTNALIGLHVYCDVEPARAALDAYHEPTPDPDSTRVEA